jgi:hypothetical protein
MARPGTAKRRSTTNELLVAGPSALDVSGDGARTVVEESAGTETWAGPPSRVAKAMPPETAAAATTTAAIQRGQPIVVLRCRSCRNPIADISTRCARAVRRFTTSSLPNDPGPCRGILVQIDPRLAERQHKPHRASGPG